VPSFPINNFLGTFNIPSTAIPDNVSKVTLLLDGSTMLDPALHVALNLDFSPDGGVTWASVHRAADRSVPLGRR
jgi:hypothetical protein